MKNVFIFLFIGILFLPTLVNAQDEYINEFNEPDEKVVLDSSWFFLTNDGVERKINVYKYCNEKCIFVIFDIQNKIPLDDEKSKAFFQNFKLKEYVDDERLNENLYSADFEDSLTCNLLAPRFGEEAQNLVMQVSAEKIAPEILPKNAAKIIKIIYHSGKKVGIVSKPTVAIIIVGASCIGSDALKSVASSTLSSCKNYVTNLRENKAYQGQFEDLNNCHSDAISKLGITLNTPDVLFQHVETQTSNIITDIITEVENAFCNLQKMVGFNCTTATAKQKKSIHDKLVTQIQELEKAKPYMDSISSEAEKLELDSSKRITQKFHESKSVTDDLMIKIVQASDMMKHEIFGLDYTWVLNLFTKPEFDYTNAKSNLGLATSKLSNSLQLQSLYKFNSASTLGVEGIKYADTALTEIAIENSKPRSIKLEIILIPIVMILFIAILFKQIF
jgi:hypothetical protein